jgi:hypothetical protein
MDAVLLAGGFRIFERAHETNIRWMESCRYRLTCNGVSHTGYTVTNIGWKMELRFLTAHFLWIEHFRRTYVWTVRKPVLLLKF